MAVILRMWAVDPTSSAGEVEGVRKGSSRTPSANLVRGFGNVASAVVIRNFDRFSTCLMADERYSALWVLAVPSRVPSTGVMERPSMVGTHGNSSAGSMLRPTLVVRPGFGDAAAVTRPTCSLSARARSPMSCYSDPSVATCIFQVPARKCQQSLGVSRELALAS